MVGARDYSGFETETWEQRSTQEHRRQMVEIVNSETAGERSALESQHGTRYSVLAELPYFDTIRMSIVDPMHNLFLGIAFFTYNR